MPSNREDRKDNRDRNQRIAFRMIRFMHDNALLRALIDPAELMRQLGVEEGRRVLEVGCGPGFFTLGAAAAVGPDGQVFAYDVNPYATAYLEEKLAARGIGNVRVEHRNAADTGLAEASVDFAFVTGVPHVVGGRHTLLEELVRVLRRGGILAYRPNPGGHGALLQAAAALGLRREGTVRRFLMLRREDDRRTDEAPRSE